MRDALEDFKFAVTGEQREPGGRAGSDRARHWREGEIAHTDDGLKIDAVLAGVSANELNRRLLSEMRRVEKKTWPRADWTSGSVTEKFFDYVPRGTIKATESKGRP